MLGIIKIPASILFVKNDMFCPHPIPTIGPTLTCLPTLSQIMSSSLVFEDCTIIFLVPRPDPCVCSPRREQFALHLQDTLLQNPPLHRRWSDVLVISFSFLKL